MAMFIELNGNPNKYFTAYVGQKIPANIWRVTTSIQADCNELHTIRSQFTSLKAPMSTISATFVGDEAKAIAANWNIMF